MRKDLALNLMLGVLTTCVVIVTALVTRRELALPEHPLVRPVEVKDWRLYALGGHAIGPATAPVSIVEFADFQCPYCRELSSTFAALRSARGNDFKVIYRHYPLPRIHPLAFDAAVAANCAAAQGRFEAYHDILFAKQDSIGIISWDQLARRAGVPDKREFSRCIESPSPAIDVRDDIEAGDRLHVRGTPTVVVEGIRILGTPSLGTLDSLLNVVLGRGGPKGR